MKYYRSYLVASACVALFSLTAAHGKNVPLRYTERLPKIDKIELQMLKVSEMGIESVEDKKVIEGVDARRIAKLWRTQKYRSFSPTCHYPVYGIKFYAHDRLVLYATLCWQCDNIAFLEPKLGETQGFDGASRTGKALRELLQTSFR